MREFVFYRFVIERNRERRFDLSAVLSPLWVRLSEEVSLFELVPEDVRPRADEAARISSNRTSDLGEVLWN